MNLDCACLYIVNKLANNLPAYPFSAAFHLSMQGGLKYYHSALYAFHSCNRTPAAAPSGRNIRRVENVQKAVAVDVDMVRASDCRIVCPPV
ncbi:hypothetical protein Aduo_016712 [Ancylostoma duodenale]